MRLSNSQKAHYIYILKTVFCNINFIKCSYLDFKKSEVVRVVLKFICHLLLKNLFFISNYPHYHGLFKSFYKHLFKNFFFSNYPHYHRLVETFLSTFIQEFFYQFPTTLTTSDFLKSIYQLLFKNFFLF